MAGEDGGAEGLGQTVARLKSEGFEAAHVGIFDLNATFRERRLRLDDLAAVLGDGGSFVNVLLQWDAAERIFGAGPFIGEPVAIDPASARPHPFEPGAALLVADYTGTSADLSPRALLARQIEKAGRLGFGVRAAFEFEFYVLEETAGTLRESGFTELTPFAKDNRCWAGESAAVHSELVGELDETLARADIAPLALGLELGPGCFEATLRAREPMRAADDAALFKLFTKAFCRRRDLTASFMAQLGEGFQGLSGHLHLSLSDGKTGRNAFFDADRPDRMSDAFGAFVAGMVELVPEAMALTHHTVNSYRRLAPGNWAPKAATWAVENYAAAVRVVTTNEDRCRLEYRLPGSDTNPFLALAFALGAGLRGIESGAALPPAFEGGGPDEMPDVGVPLPHDLFEATRRLDTCAAARELWGEAFIDHFVRSLRAEEAALRREVGAAERARYLEVL